MTDKSYLLSPDQAIQIMAVSVLLKDGDLTLRGKDQDLIEKALSVIECVGEELALQFGNGDD